MKTQIKHLCVALVLLATSSLELSRASAQGTAFTYQGQLQNNGSLANGHYDMAFSLFATASGGTATAGPITNSATAVSNGLFSTTIDFGAGVFNGTNYWLDISVSPSGSNTFTELTPRQVITPNPYTIYSENAGSANTASTADVAGSANSVPAANIVGTMQVQQLPVGVVMNNQKGITLSGTFNGNGAGLTNLPTNAALLNANQMFSGVNNFTNNVVVGTPPPYWEDKFTVHPVANRGLGIVAANGGGGSVTSGMTIESVNDNATANQPLEFRGNPCVFTTGNTGFGTTSPFRFVQVHPAANCNLGIYQSSLTSGMTIENVNDANSANEPLEFRGSPNVFTTGNVGIGITNPTNALAVNGTISLTGSLNLPTTTASPDVIYSGNSLLLDGDNNGNFFSGVGAGNLTLSGSSNTGIGDGALAAVTTGGPNTAFGSAALRSSTSGYNNTAFGDSALVSNINGFENEADGHVALYHNTNGGANSANGSGALYNNTSGSFNTASGYHVLFSNTTGSNNVACGFEALNNATTASNNIAEGFEAGYNITTGSSNIDIGNMGFATDTNIIRIGTSQISTYIAGNLYASGAVFSNGVDVVSDRGAKENFSPINPETVLAKVATMPVTEWNYKTDESVEHIGPMAQDFHASFGLNGADDKHISVLDEGGVALAAIQGLNQKLEADNAELKLENNLLVKRLDQLEAQVRAMVQKNR